MRQPRGYDVATLGEASKRAADKLAHEIFADFMEGLDEWNTEITCRYGNRSISIPRAQCWQLRACVRASMRACGRAGVCDAPFGTSASLAPLARSWKIQGQQ